MKLSDFLRQQGLTPDGSKSVYQAFIDNLNVNFINKWPESAAKKAFVYAFDWSDSAERFIFWDDLDDRWRQVENPENDMLWLLDGKESPSEQKEYPRWFKSTETEMIVQFDSLRSGKVIGKSDAFADGYYTTTWIPHTDKKEWQEVQNPELTQEDEVEARRKSACINKVLDEMDELDEVLSYHRPSAQHQVLGLPDSVPDPLTTFTKNDSTKPNLAVLFDQPLALAEVACALEYGAKKYSRKNWALCDNLERYEAAPLRHMLADHNGELIDPESGLHHTAHAICSLLFKLELQLQETQHDQTK